MAASLTMGAKLAEAVLFLSRQFTLDQNVLQIPLPIPSVLHVASVASVVSVKQPLLTSLTHYQ